MMAAELLRCDGDAPQLDSRGGGRLPRLGAHRSCSAADTAWPAVQGAWSVSAKWVLDSESHNEWMNPRDYDMSGQVGGWRRTRGAMGRHALPACTRALLGRRSSARR
jgi:hypothetical protein